MKNKYLKTTILLLTVFLSIVGFAQNKNISVQNFKNPFPSKKSINSNQTVFPANRNVAKLEKSPTINGSFNINLSKENLNSESLKSSLNKILNLNQQFSFELLNQKSDNLGFTHINFQQYFNGISIDGFIVQAHLKEGKVTTINGQLAEFKEIQTTATVSSESALTMAKENLQVRGVLLNEYPIELVIIRIQKEKEYIYKLAYKVRIDASSPFVMCNVFVDATNGAILNKVNLIAHADTPGTAQTYYSGAQAITMDSYSGSYRLRENSRKIETYDATSATFSTGGFAGHTDFTNSTTTWNGIPYISSFTISSASTSWWYNSIVDPNADFYIIIKDASSTPVYTSGYINNTNAPVTFYPNLFLVNPPYSVELWDYDSGNGDDYGGSYSLISTTGTQVYSGGGNSGSYVVASLNNPALDVHWGMEKTFDFYNSVFGRNSFDGAGSTIKNFVNGTMEVAGTQNNAFALPAPYDLMVYGMGDGIEMDPLVGIDVEGHEFTHMVVNYNGSGGLTYTGESGALNESFADIFGTCIEFYSGVSPDWTIGEGLMLSAPYMRSMSNPSDTSLPVSMRQPDTYSGSYWANPADLATDHGGVHKNSGVQNFWFYLLSQGGSGTNDIGNAYSVTAIGITQARQIAYRNLTTYLTPSATFYDSYLGSLQSAEDLYGNPSSQYDAVRDAWYAVGIGNDPNSYCSGTTNLTATSGTFTDGSGSANYNDNANCKWVIAPAGANNITLNFTAFDTEANYDTVFVYDGFDETGTLLMTWWGNTLPPTINSTGGALCVKFTSDITINATGWSATYSSTGITPTCGGGIVLATPSGSFNDGSGASNYGNNQLCYWFIAPPCASSVTLSFSAFNTEAGYDGIIVYDDLDGTNQIAVLSGTTIPTPVTSTTGVMLVVFVSDYVVTMQGFNANYTSVGSAYCSGTTTLNTVDAGTISDGSGGNNYCNNQDCRWLIQPPQATSVTLYFNSFDLEAASADGLTIYDAVEVYDGINTSAPLIGKFTGSTLPPSVTSSGGSMYIKFYSDLAVNAQGWSADYSSTTTTYCTGTTNLTAPSGTFSDGSGAITYGNNSNCSWLIQPASATAINLSFSVFNTELSYDGVLVYDGSNNSAPLLGQFSGTSIPSPVNSTGGSMYVEFLSDPSVRLNGWTANYNSTITGINNINQNNLISVYPNPFTNKLTIDLNLDKESNVEITVTNVLGQTIKHYSKKMVAGNTKEIIEMNDLPANTYWIKILVNEKQSVFKTVKID